MKSVILNDPSDRWREMITKHMGSHEVPLHVRTPLRRLRGQAGAVLVECSDGLQYAVKGRQNRRSLVADHVVGLLARVVEAPVPEVRLVEVPSALIVQGSFLETFEAGVGHGSRFVPRCIDSWDIRYPDDLGNAERFAALAVLYGWADPEDRQFLYSVDTPHLVHSVDHGSFFCGSSDWTEETLATASPAILDQLVVTGALVKPQLLMDVLDRLDTATDDAIAQVVSTPPSVWGISLDERVALAQYLSRRRDQLLVLRGDF